MCDTLVERVTGARTATEAYSIELQVVMTDTDLLGTDASIGDLVGSGAIPSELALELSETSLAWMRRLLTDPMDATVVNRDTKRRSDHLDRPVGEAISIDRAPGPRRRLAHSRSARLPPIADRACP